MAYDLEEQDQLDALKTWWKTHGDKVTTAITVVLVIYVLFQAWSIYQNRQILAASTKYELLTQTNVKELKAVQSVAGDLIEHYSTTPYAGRAALWVAKVNYEANDAKSARSQLTWALQNAKEDAVKTLAGIELAGIQLEAKEYDAALKTLESATSVGFEGLVSDLKGDIYQAQGKVEEAKKSYVEALANLDTRGLYGKYTQRKLEALGS